MRYWLKYIKAWIILKRKSLYRYTYSSSDDYVRFAIVCTSRTGSTWLHTLLNSHPAVQSYGQIINKYHKQNLVPELDEMVYYPHPKLIKAVGLKIFYGDESIQYNKYLEDVEKRKEIKIIHITRKDTLAQFTSLKLSERTWQWSKSRAGDRSEKIVLDPQEYEEFKVERLAAVEQMRQRFSQHQALEITYEDLRDNLEGTTLEIQRFLGVAPRKLFSALRKQSSESLENQIENWDDFS